MLLTSGAKSPLRRVAGVSVLLITVWSTFVLFATNEERLSSAVIRRITAAVVSDSKIREAMGHNIAMEPSWYLFGSPRIAGQVGDSCSCLSAHLTLNVPPCRSINCRDI